jgi:8-oxo-dGTP diphosphatase
MNKDNTHILARAVVLDGDNILLYKTLDMRENFYFLPGGHIEHGESAQNALKREMIEETGCEIIIKRFLGCLENIFENSESCKCHNHEYSFIFEVESKSLNMRMPLSNFDKRMELAWMPLSELANIPFKAEALKELIPKWLNHSLNDAFGSIMI